MSHSESPGCLSVADRSHLMPHGGQREIANALGIAESTVSQVMNETMQPKTERGRKTVQRIREAVAEKLGRPFEDVWPPEEEATQGGNAPVMARAS
jgi:DNA-binding transcriptional regulator YdaS (Cro superfamily)